ncbi:kunitz-type protease inhibitor 4-like [Elgaria multicarinata webbii]|uniref:kunitz-type protease inhibitor 4-like n=1 Tax=Elgaria multicarinata webbii TaxID=159646 RepID=UPI002FCD6489
MKARFVLLFLVGLLVAWAELPSATGQTDICCLPEKGGDCLALIPRWFYNWKTRRCEKFTYGGCHGNENNFKTFEECRRRCGAHGEIRPGQCGHRRAEGGHNASMAGMARGKQCPRHWAKSYPMTDFKQGPVFMAALWRHKTPGSRSKDEEERQKPQAISLHHGEPLGACPKPIGHGTCVEACNNGDSCGPGEKCCSNGCGHQCMKVTGGPC